jgi:hypothetical protein
VIDLKPLALFELMNFPFNRKNIKKDNWKYGKN